jgi:hypothetical protein
VEDISCLGWHEENKNSAAITKNVIATLLLFIAYILIMQCVDFLDLVFN